MGTVVKPNTFAAGNTISSAQVNANFDTLYTLVNGLLDDANLANGAVTENKIENLAVTEGKIDALAVSNAKVAPGIDAAKLANGMVSNAEFQYLDGVTSAIQTQLNAKQATITGAASTIVSSDMTPYRVVVSSGVGKVAASDVTTTELGYLDGVTSAIQTQLDAKNPSLSIKDVGAIAFARLIEGPSTVAHGATTDGGNLRAAAIGGIADSLYSSNEANYQGTWKNLGPTVTMAYGDASLWLRVS